MKGWLDKYQDGGELDESALSSVKNVLSKVGDVTSAPARGLTYLATGKYQDPSEAMGITNPYGAFATDLVLDPMNLVGAGLLKLASGPSKLSKVTKAAGKLSKAADVTSAVKNYKSPDIKLDPNKFPGPKNIPINPKQFNQAVKSTLSALTERGQKLDQVTGGKFNVTPDDIHYHGTFGGRPIVEVKTPYGSEHFYKSTGWAGKKEINPGQWQAFGQWMDAPAGTVRPNSINDWFVKGPGFDKFYGSQSFGNVANSLDDALIKKYNVPSEDLNKFLNFQNMQSDANTFIPKRKDGGWLDKYNDGGPVQENYNDYSVSAGEGFQGDGYSNVGRNYSPAWGGQFAMGGSMPGAVGFMYARDSGSNPSEDEGRNKVYKTDASAEKGKKIKKTKTVDAEMLPEVTVVGSNDPQTESFYRNIIDDLPRDEDMGVYEGLMDLGKKYGFPKVHPIDENSLLSKIVMSIGEDAKSPANYNPLSKTIQADNIEQWISEMAHHVQMKDNVLNKGVQWIKNDLPALAVSNIILGNRSAPYKLPGSVENEAHSIIEPKLQKELQNSYHNYWNLPYIDKKITEDIEYGLPRNFKFENGGSMQYYQNGLDWKPRSMAEGGEVVPGENEEVDLPSIWDDKMASIKKTRLRGPGTRTRFMPPQLLDEDQFEVEDVNYDQLSAPHFVNSLNPVESKNYIPKMQDRFPDMENMYYTKNAEFNENWSNLNLLDESSNKIKLNTGRFRGAKVPTNIIDELAKTSRKQNVPLGQLLTLMGRESMFGSGTDRNEDRAGSKTSLMSGWNVAEDYQPYNNIRFLADNKVPGVKPTPTPHGYEYEITDERAMNNYLRKNPKLLDQYKAKLDSTKVLGDQDAFDLAAKFLKKKGVKGYNPGDPKYTEAFNQDYNLLKQDKGLMKYVKQKGYTFEDGGSLELTKLDQLTNFTNYNTKQPGGWLDKYQ
jgi:hypothetical protein